MKNKKLGNRQNKLKKTYNTPKILPKKSND